MVGICRQYDIIIKPIFHQIFVGRVAVNNAEGCALGTFQIIFTPIEILNF